MEEKRAGDRREKCAGCGDGHHSPCEKLNDHLEFDAKVLAQQELIISRLDLITKNQEAISATLVSMTEILEAWNNTKGFVKTMVTISGFMKWLVAFGASVAAVWYFVFRR